MITNYEQLLNYGIIGLIGEQGAGKTYISSQLATMLKNCGYDTAVLSFATPIRYFLARVGIVKSQDVMQRICSIDEFRSEMLHLIPDDIIVGKYLKQLYEIYTAAITVKEKYRLLAQLIGTEVGRAYLEDIWVDCMYHKLLALSTFMCKVIIDDIRFFNEYSMLSKLNFVLCEVVRPNSPISQINLIHKSEVGWRELKPYTSYEIFNLENKIVIRQKGGNT